jgi:hypothetical protein
MKGLELSKKYYETYGKELLNSEFSDVLPLLAIGLAGSGSECYGYDDELSKDHDFEPGFCIFLPDEDIIDRKTAFLLERAYAKLPKEFMGFTRSPLNPVGGNRHGVILISDFFSEKVGSSDGNLSLEQWFTVPEYGLLEATNGEVFSDHSGRFTSIRERLRYFPQNVRLKKLAGHLLLMGQAGLYNYLRCISRKDTGAAQLAIYEFVQSALHTIFLLNNSYMPYYKWCFRKLKELPKLSEYAKDLEYLLSSGNTESESTEKTKIIQNICTAISEELQMQGLTKAKCAEMEMLAYTVNEKIDDPNIRNMHILQGV